jgi:hypothetical protein
MPELESYTEFFMTEILQKTFCLNTHAHVNFRSQCYGIWTYSCNASVVCSRLERFYVREKYFYYKTRLAISCTVHFYNAVVVTQSRRIGSWLKYFETQPNSDLITAPRWVSPKVYFCACTQTVTTQIRDTPISCKGRFNEAAAQL